MPNNNLKQTPIPAVSRMMKIVNPDGTVNRSGQLLLEQLQAATTLFGASADRPDAGETPDGAIYVDSDRGVIYQNQGGEWRYIAGTMYGTLAPDQRPDDLGVNDGGFDFRVTDPDAANKGREFIWSGAEWIETTPVQYGTHAARLAVPAAGILYGSLWVETDRGNVVYQVQGGAWKYAAGAMVGTVIAVDQRPTGLGANDTGFLFLSTDSTSVEWNGGSWKAIGSLLDIGPAPPVSQFRIKANGLGCFSVLTYSPDNIQLGFDTELDIAGVGNWKAVATTCAWISKTGGRVVFSVVSGATPGAATGQIQSALIDCATASWTFPNAVNISSGGLQYAGQRVVGPRMAAIAAPAGGTTIDTQARAAIQLILNTLSFAAGGHGLTG